MKQSITLTGDHIVKYLCKWNGDEVIQIHTEETLRADYKDSNLFNCKEAKETKFSAYGLPETLLLEDYLKQSQKDSTFIGISFIAHNMEIQRMV
tara:strand:- start:869 stop:1150 length:282 start_codon:yes stop_codon:yes gene_type:complete